jgi:PAS domain S-box-containing protein
LTDNDKIPSIHILLVEDNKHDRLSFRRAFEKSSVSFEITECERAEEAYGMLHSGEHSFSIVVIDIHLPGISGLDLVKDLIDGNVSLPLVILTGSGSEEVAVEALKLGVDDYIIKDLNQGYLKLLPLMLPEVVRKYNERLARERAEEELKINQHRLELAMNVTNLGIWGADFQTGEIYSDDRWGATLGYSEEEYREHLNSWIKLVHPEDVKIIEKSIANNLEEKTSFFECEYRVKDKSGGWRWIYARGSVVERDDNGTPLKIMGTMLDVTERKRTEEELRLSQQRLGLAVTATSLCIWDINFETRKVHLNLEWGTTLGYTEDEFGEFMDSWDRLVHPDDYATFTQKMLDSMEGKTPILENEYRVRTKFGEWRWIYARGSVVERDENKKPLRMTGTLLDITERKRAEEEFRLNQQRLDLAISATNLCIWGADFQTGESYYDYRWGAALGYSEEEFKEFQHTWYKLIHPGDLESFTRKLLDNLLGKTPFLEDEYRVKDKFGEWRWVQNRGRVVERDREENPFKIAGTMLDITERKRIEKALKESEELYRNLFETALVGIWRANIKDGTLLRANPKCAEITGVKSVDELLDNYRTSDFFPLEDRIENLALLEERGELSDFETHLTCEDGSEKHVSISAKVFPEKGYVEGIIVDITDRKRAEEALQESEKRYRFIVENVRDIIFVLDELANFRFLNRALEELTGYEVDEMIDTNFWGIVTPDSLEAAQEYLPRLMSGEELEHKEIDVYDKNGKVETIEFLATPIFEDDKVVEILGITRIVTERKRMEDELRHYADELKRANEEVKNFTYIVSHDLKAPLINLKGFSRELEAAIVKINSNLGSVLSHLPPRNRDDVEAALTGDIPQCLEFISSSVARIDNLIKAILKLSRLGRRELVFKKLDMKKIIDVTLKSIAHQIDEGNIKVETKKLPGIVADQTSMEQVFGNLLDNATKFLDPNRPGKIEISGKKGDGETTFYIRDNGRGIRKGEFDKIFQVFHKAGRDDRPGEGMGLAYVKTMVERHGGRIWCESEPGVGTTFIFTISHKLTLTKDYD